MVLQKNADWKATASGGQRAQHKLWLAALVALVLAACGDGASDGSRDAGSDSALADVGDAQDATDVAQQTDTADSTDTAVSTDTGSATDTLTLTDAAETDASEDADDVEPLSDADATVATDVEAGTDATDASQPGTDAVVLPDPCSADVDCADPGLPCVVARCVPQPASAPGGAKVCKLVLQPDATPCDDGQACTSGEACKAGQCQGGDDVCVCKTSADCAGFDDGNPCNGTYYCDTTGTQPVCKTNPATVVTCAGATGPCSASVCNPASGQCETQFAPNGTLCNDGDSCSADDMCTDGTCKGGLSICACKTTADCAGKEDGNLCNGKLYCDTATFPFACKVNPATIVTCGNAFDTECSKNTCDPATGQCAMQLAADASPCSDGNPCTSGDSCLNGKCKADTNICQCVKNADCAQFEDGNLCNGKLFCNLSLPQPACEVNPATLVLCASVNDTECKQNQCDPLTGQCAIASVNENAPCSDGNLCSSGDHCEQGVCVAAAETCDCTEDADCAGFEDGNACNGTLYCDKAAAPFQCRINPATVVDCPDGDDTACLQNRCDPGSGQCAMTVVNQDGPCDADDFDCTAADSCVDGVCVPGANICACESAADCGVWEDSDICNGTLYCDKTQQPFVCKVNPATLKTCPSVDDTECVFNRCDPATGGCAMTPRNNGDVCNADNSACTVGDVCNNGICEVGTNICACQQDSDCDSADDGNLCNGKFYCDKSAQPFACKLNPASVVTCDPASDSACTKNTCQPKSGTCAMTTLPDNTSCNDGNVCSVSDVCIAGTCSGTNICACQVNADCAPFDDGNLCNGTLFCDTSSLPFTCKPNQTPVVCPPSSNICSVSVCNPASGLCQTSADPSKNGEACDDGDACTTATVCASGSCQGSSTTCDDGDECTFDICIPGGGCQFTFMPAAPCTDGMECTQQDKCAVGGCIGTPVYCDDDNDCTSDQCVEGSSCVYSPNSASCNDGNLCTIKDSCVMGSCSGLAKVCGDGNPCTDDSCSGSTGNCVFVASASRPCDDGLTCTIQDSCDLGVCGGKPACDDGNLCTTDKCLEGVPCIYDPLSGGPCDDGSSCTKSDKCMLGDCKGAYACDDGNPCTKDSCDLALGCTSMALDGGACDDDDLCTDVGTCSAGTCIAPPTTCSGGFCTAVCLPDVGCAPIIPCEDGNPCTSDTCDELAGCIFEADTDGNPCPENEPFPLDFCWGGSCGTCQRASAKVMANTLFDFEPTAALFDGIAFTVAGRGVSLSTSDSAAFVAEVSPNGGPVWSLEPTPPNGGAFADVVDLGSSVLAFGYQNMGDSFEAQGWVSLYLKGSGTTLSSKTFGEEAQSESFRTAVQTGSDSWLAAGTVGSGPDVGNLLLARVDVPLAFAGSKLIAVPSGMFTPQRILSDSMGQAYYIVGTRDTGTGQEAHVVAVNAALDLLWQQSYPKADSLSTACNDGVLRNDAELLCVGSRDVGGGTLPYVVAIQTANGVGQVLSIGSVSQGAWEGVQAYQGDLMLVGHQETAAGNNVVLAARVDGVDGSLKWSRTYAAGVLHTGTRWVTASAPFLAFVTQVVPDYTQEAEGWLQELDPDDGEGFCLPR